MLKILSFDPGSQVAGFACLGIPNHPPLRPHDFKVIEVGVVKIPQNLKFYQKIQKIYQFAKDKTDEHQPHCCVIERAFFGVNNATAIKLGEIRGALTAGIAGLDIAVEEITPAEVKKVIAGHGNASKELVAQSVTQLLRIKHLDLPFDATDALAIALSFGLKCNQRDVYKSLQDRQLVPPQTQGKKAEIDLSTH